MWQKPTEKKMIEDKAPHLGTVHLKVRKQKAKKKGDKKLQVIKQITKKEQDKTQNKRMKSKSCKRTGIRTAQVAIVDPLGQR